MPDTFVPLQSLPVEDEAEKFQVGSGAVAPFPRARFLQFLKHLKVQSKDYGLVPFKLLGSQAYALDELERGLAEGITTFYFLKARQLGMCVDPNSKVLTADLRWKKIDDVQPGEKLVACDEEPAGGKGAGRKMRTCVVQARNEVFKQAVEITLDDGTVLIATPEHRFLCKFRNATETEWRHVSKFRLGDKVRTVTTPWQQELIDDHWMGGLIDGEGWISSSSRAGACLGVCQVAGAVLDRARTYFHSLGYSFREEIDDRKPGDTSKLGNKPVHRLVLSRMSEMFRLLGTTRPTRFKDNHWWEDKELPGKRVGDCWKTVIGLRYLNERRMVDLQTSTKTYICEGVVSHNSTFFLALDMFWAMEYKGLLGVFIVHEEPARDDFRTAIEVFFAETPKSHKIGYVRHNRNLLILKNASKFRYLIAGTSSGRKGGLGRSGSANYVHSTETAFYGNDDDLAEFRSQTSSLYPHRLQIYESTANGFNHYSDAWDMAKKDPTKRAIFIGWYRDERNQLPLDHPFFIKFMPDGLNTSLTPLERKRVREVREQYGYEISLQQVAWWRWHLESEKNGDMSLMDQEYPWSDFDAFQATGSQFFTAESLTNCMREAKKHPFKTFRYKLTHKFQETQLQQTRDARSPLRVWEEASRFGYYALGCDPAFGSSDEADRSVISVWRCFADCMVQVAEFCSPEPSTYQTAWVLCHLAGYFGTTWVMPIIEITGGAGKAVMDEVEKVRKLTTEMKPQEDERGLRNILGNMRSFFYKRIDSLGGALVKEWSTTEDLKRMALNQFKNGIELGRVIPHSVPLLEEMQRIVNDEGHIGGEGRSKDDRVIGAALAYQAWNVWTQPRVKALGLSYARSQEIDQRGGTEPVDRLILNFLKKQKISVPS